MDNVLENKKPLVFTVTRQEPEFITPAEPTPYEVKELSDIDDQAGLWIHVPGIQFYKSSPKMLGVDPAKVIKEAVSKVLVPFYPLAGRLREKDEKKLVVECTGEGIMFVEADADVCLEEFSEAQLHPPIPCMDELLRDYPGYDGILNSPLVLMQVTRLKCGGFILAHRINHAMSDGMGLAQFLNAVGEMARGAQFLSVNPVWKRELVSARNPPQVTCVHREYDQIPDIPLDDDLVLKPFFFDSNGEKVWIEAEESELLKLEFDTELDAYRAYCRYSYLKCFGVRYSNERNNSEGVPVAREFCCCKEGNKDKGALGEQFTKLSRRTGYKAMIYFRILNGKYMCTRHDMIHNHAFCHPSEVHNLRCHKKIEPSEVEYLKHLKNSGVRLAEGIRSLVKEAGGSHLLGFEYADDAANAVRQATKKRFDRTDCNTLINILKQRAANEEDFYYDFELDEDNSLVSVFFRDRIMRQDYEAFYELLGNDATYCTNKYDMVCAPFVGINPHTRICMFGIGFMKTERTESYEWLYKTFLVSMGGKQPMTIMTDQSKAMENAIATCFPESKYRLCV